jgi:hypothetical protein
VNCTSLEPLDHSPESFVLSEEQMAAVDETMLYAEDMRNVLVRAEFVARQKRFDSRFGELV